MVVVERTGCEGLAKWLSDYIQEIWMEENGYNDGRVNLVIQGGQALVDLYVFWVVLVSFSQIMRVPDSSWLITSRLNPSKRSWISSLLLNSRELT